MGHDISPIALELLFSPGFFLVKEDAHVQAPETLSPEPDQHIQEAQAAPEPQLFFIVHPVPDSQSPEGQMLQKMASYIHHQLGISGTLHIGGPELWTQQQGEHHWVFFGAHAAIPAPNEFSAQRTPQGRVLYLPETRVLAHDPLLKKQSVEAFVHWSNL
ncbi:MAG: hypothetical protein RL160_1782 [Bacteroidota bacterium]|jgi:hypothetical protein